MDVMDGFTCMGDIAKCRGGPRALSTQQSIIMSLDRKAKQSTGHESGVSSHVPEAQVTRVIGDRTVYVIWMGAMGTIGRVKEGLSPSAPTRV